MKKVVIIGLRAYQLFLSPIIGGQCRFFPSCSAYTKEAVEKYGVLKGLFLGGRRILRCHPLHPGGIDLIP